MVLTNDTEWAADRRRVSALEMERLARYMYMYCILIGKVQVPHAHTTNTEN
jgi:hypothetical protein